MFLEKNHRSLVLFVARTVWGALEKIKTREGFEIFKCKKKACPYYQQRMREIHRDSYLKATY
ncbi:hypothetical protein, partial [Alkalibacterium sp. s-m-28]